MSLRYKMDHEKWGKGIKLTAAAILAIMAANLLGLRFSATAGIITILSIQNTKKETLRMAGRRALAFLCALGLGALAFWACGFTIPAFALYLLGFSCVCLCFGWTEAIAMDSVLITHFLSEGNMGAALVINEVCLFLVGTGMGIAANLHLRKEAERYDRLAASADRRMKDSLKLLNRQLLASEREAAKMADLEREGREGLEELEQALKLLQDCAYRNWNNTFFQASVNEIEYAKMRIRQAEVLRRIFASVKMTKSMPAQAHQVAALIERIEAEYDRDNTVEALSDALRELFEQMRCEALPLTRAEFEARAVLFYLLKQLEEFLQLKRDFVAAASARRPA